MQEVLAIAPLPGFPYRGVLWDDLRSNPDHSCTVVQETEISGVWYRCHWIVNRRNSHSDCRQQFDRADRVCEGVVHAISATNLFHRFKWTMRVIALILLFMLTIANLVWVFVSDSVDIYSSASLQALRRRLDPPKHTASGPFFAWYDFKKPAFNIYTFGGVLNFLGLYTGGFHLPLSPLHD